MKVDFIKGVEKQAYFFKDSKVLRQKEKIDNSLSIKVAESCHMDDILKGSGDFFDNINERILNEEIYIIRKGGSIPGCWYYNHNSKKTLEGAGMYSDTRLLKVHY